MAMTKQRFKNDCIILNTLDDLVPQEHLVRKLDNCIDFTFIEDLVKDLYSDFGRQSIPPVVLFKLIFINIIFGINSMRRTCEECKVNIAYRWFLGLSMYDDIPNYSTWSQNYIRRYKDSDVFDKIFENNSNLFEIFNQEIYSNLEQTNQEKQKAPTLWIPCFEIDSHLQCDNLNCFENVEISKNKEQFYVNNIDEFIKVKFDYEKERESMFSVDPKDSDIVIKDDFLFGIINLDVLTNFNMSTILLFHVTKDHFMYREN